MSDWKAESLRVTVFTKPSAEPSTLNGRKTWIAIASGEPDRSNKDPRTLSSEDAGLWKDIWLTVRLTPGRIDVFLTPVPAEMLPEPPTEIPQMGRFDDRFQLAREAGTKLLGTVPDVVRIAFGAALLVPTAQRSEAYAVLGQHLHTVKMDPAMEELVYQVNRPRAVPLRPGAKDSIKMNRLGKWSAQKVTRSLAVIPAGGGFPVIVASDVTTLGYTCRAELDLNTDAEHTDVLPADCLVPLFGQLIEAAVHLAEQGEVGES